MQPRRNSHSEQGKGSSKCNQDYCIEKMSQNMYCLCINVITKYKGEFCWITFHVRHSIVQEKYIQSEVPI